MYAHRGSSNTARTVDPTYWTVRPLESNRRAGRQLRRNAHRHTRLTFADHVAFWRAQRHGTRHLRIVTAWWSLYLGLAVVVGLIVAGSIAGAALV